MVTITTNKGTELTFAKPVFQLPILEYSLLMEWQEPFLSVKEGDGVDEEIYNFFMFDGFDDFIIAQCSEQVLGAIPLREEKYFAYEDFAEKIIDMVYDEGKKVNDERKRMYIDACQNLVIQLWAETPKK